MSDVSRSSDTTATVDELPPDTLFGLLCDSRRRDVLRCLLGGPGEVSLEELSAAVASRGNPPSDQRLARVSIDLHHVHLPKLADAGVVRYDADSEVVEPLVLPVGVETVLERFGNAEGGAPRTGD